MEPKTPVANTGTLLQWVNPSGENQPLRDDNILNTPNPNMESSASVTLTRPLVDCSRAEIKQWYAVPVACHSEKEDSDDSKSPSRTATQARHDTTFYTNKISFSKRNFSQWEKLAKRWYVAKLATEIIDLLGIRHIIKGVSYICLLDVDQHEEEILTYWYSIGSVVSSKYKGSLCVMHTPDHLHRYLVNAILQAAGHLTTRKQAYCRRNNKSVPCTNWMVDPDCMVHDSFDAFASKNTKHVI